MNINLSKTSIVILFFISTHISQAVVFRVFPMERLQDKPSFIRYAVSIGNTYENPQPVPIPSKKRYDLGNDAFFRSTLLLSEDYSMKKVHRVYTDTERNSIFRYLCIKESRLSMCGSSECVPCDLEVDSFNRHKKSYWGKKLLMSKWNILHYADGDILITDTKDPSTRSKTHSFKDLLKNYLFCASVGYDATNEYQKLREIDQQCSWVDRISYVLDSGELGGSSWFLSCLAFDQNREPVCIYIKFDEPIEALMEHTGEGKLKNNPKQALIDPNWIISGNTVCGKNIDFYIPLGKNINLLHSKDPILRMPSIPRSRIHPKAAVQQTPETFLKTRGIKISLEAEQLDPGTLMYTTLPDGTHALYGFTTSNQTDDNAVSGNVILELKNAQIDSIIIQDARGYNLRESIIISKTQIIHHNTISMYSLTICSNI